MSFRQNCFKMGLWGGFWATVWPGGINASKLTSGGLLGGHLGLQAEVLQNGHVAGFWGRILVWKPKCLKIGLWKRSGATFSPGGRNGLKLVSGSLLGLHFGLDAEII